MDLALLLDHVIPSEGVLYKASGLWEYYESDSHLAREEVYMSQKASEDFRHFVERVVQQLMKDEEDEEERLVAIDYAIWSNH